MNGQKLMLPAFGVLLLSGLLLFGPVRQAGAVPPDPAIATPNGPGATASAVYLPLLHNGKKPVRPTATPTATTVPPTATTVPPTATTVPPIATKMPPTATTVPPTATKVPPTATPVPTTDPNARYVAKNGVDTNPGTLAAPWRTIGKAASTLIAGQTVYIRAGVYQEVVNFSRSGTASQPINVLAYPGEVPVVDGNNWTLPTSSWGVLFKLSGDYIHVSGIEVRNSLWMGVGLYGQHDTASYMNSHHNLENGILANGDYSIVENSKVWQNCYSNSPSTPVSRSNWASGLSSARDLRDGLTSYAILRSNEVYNNWGEGVSSYESDHTVIEDNIVYDNQGNMYISDTTNALVQRNLVYVTPSSPMGTASGQSGIAMGDETYNPPSANNTIINNFVYGAYRNFYWWQGVQGGGMNNVLIANNTFVNAHAGAAANFQINNGPHTNTRIIGNVIEQDDSVTIASIGTRTGLSFSNNLWSKTPSSTAAGASDIVANPQLAKTGTLAPGTFTPDYFKLLSGSPARDHAAALSQVTVDYFKHARGNAPDMGGDEYVSP